MLRTAALPLLAALALAASAAATSTVAAGDPQLAAAQAALHAKGLYTGTIDGFPGPQTVEALRRLQRSAGLPATGALEPRTRKLLGLARLGVRPLAFGTSGSDVLQLQFLLAWHGFPSGELSGSFDGHLDKALRGFQAWAGLTPDGLAGRSTLAALRGPLPRSPLRLAWPLAGPVADGFGPRGMRFHAGIDIPAATGVPVAAAGSGVVTWAGAAGDWGNLVVVSHGSGVSTYSAHLSRIDVTFGQRVRQGQRIGLVGATGHADGPHLHFEVRVGGASVDPLTALPA